MTEIDLPKFESLALELQIGPQGQQQPFPWSVWTSNSFRRVSCHGDGDVLTGIIQRSDGHPDLSMPAYRLDAWIELTNALPAMFNHFHELRSRVAQLEGVNRRLAETLHAIAEQQLGNDKAATIAAKRIITEGLSLPSSEP